MMTAVNKVSRPEPAALIGIKIPGVYKRRFIEYLTDTQLTRLSFWLKSQKEGTVSTHRLNQIEQAAKQRGLQLPLSWQKLPFDNEAQRAEWELWATISVAKKKVFPIARTKPAKKHAAKKGK